MPVLAVIAVGAGGYWEKPPATTGGLASVTETLRADQAPPVDFGESGRNSNALTADVQNLQTADHFADAGNMVVVPTATPTPTPSPTIESIVTVATVGPPHEAPPYTVEQWRPLVATIFPAESVDTMLRIIACESKGDPNATGAAGERGLAQIHPIHADSTYDPEANIRAAYRISGGGASWEPWASCATLAGIP